MCHEICLGLLRKSDDWIAACSDSEWFKEQEMGKAESTYNLWADREACKFEKEYVRPEGEASVEANPTVAVVSMGSPLRIGAGRLSCRLRIPRRTWLESSCVIAFCPWTSCGYTGPSALKWPR